jgi:hypothetical protein
MSNNDYNNDLGGYWGPGKSEIEQREWGRNMRESLIEQRINALEQERDQLKATLTQIQTLAGTCAPHRMPIVLQQIHDLAKSKLKDEI